MAKRTSVQKSSVTSDAELLAAAAWQRKSGLLGRFTQHVDGRVVEFYADDASATAVLRALKELATDVQKLREKNEELSEIVDDLEKQARTTTTTKKPAATLEQVPLAMIAPFAVTPELRGAAKRDPLVALAVQASRAMQADASELERARLLAMAAAASRRALDAFWAASQERSRKNLTAAAARTKTPKSRKR